MTEHRRVSDPRIDELLDHQRTHLRDFHGNLKAGEGAKLIEEHKNMLNDITDLKHDSALSVELLAGKIIVDKFTGRETGEREPGIAFRVESLEYQANGGRGMSIRLRDKAQMGLWGGVSAAVVYSAGLIVAALIR